MIDSFNNKQNQFDKNIQIDMEKEPKISKMIISILAVVLICLLFTGFGYQPWWVFVIVLILGLVITLPACFNSYWSMNYNIISIISYSKNDAIKLLQLLKIRPKFKKEIKYDQIKAAQVVYKKILRVGLFNFNPDSLLLSLKLKDGEIIELDLGNCNFDILNNIYQILNYHDVKVEDKQDIWLALKNDKNLYRYFHQNGAK